MDGPHLIYFSDPMCSWCYGFSPVIADIRRAFGRALPIRLVMGGLRPGTDTPMTPEAKSQIVGHWHHVEEAANLPFDGSVMDRADFCYDTDPAARAVVWVRRHDAELALTFLGKLQAGFYAQSRDITQVAVLAAMVSEIGLSAGDFVKAYDGEDLKNETWSDYGTSQRAGVTGFPTLVAGPSSEGAYGVVTRGFQPGRQVLAILHSWLESAPSGTA